MYLLSKCYVMNVTKPKKSCRLNINAARLGFKTGYCDVMQKQLVTFRLSKGKVHVGLDKFYFF